MRSVFLACVCAGVAAQNAALYSFSGEFLATTGTANPIYTDSFGCNNDSSAYPYTTFNYTFLTAGVRALYGFNLYSVAVVQGNNAYEIADLCHGGTALSLTNSDTSYISSDCSVSYMYQYGQYFLAGSYTFIVYGYNLGGFGGEIWDGTYHGQTAVSATANKTWHSLSTYSGGSCYESSYAQLYDTQVVRVNQSGYYNIYVTFAQNLALAYGYQLPSAPSYTILNGNYSIADLSLVNCSNANYTNNFGAGSNLNIQTFNTWLTANTTYTIVIQAGDLCSSDTYFGDYALTVTPSRYYPFTNATLFSRPDQGTCGAGCTCQPHDSPAVPQAYAVTTFTVPANTYFWLWGNQYDANHNYYDLEFYIYNFDNSVLLSTCPSLLLGSCWAAVDTPTGVIYYSGSNTEFTIVATAYSNNEYDGYVPAMGLYILSGPAITSSGSSAPTSSKAPTTAAPNTRAPTPSVSAAPTTRAPTPSVSAAPTVAGSSAAPTVAGSSAAPTTAGTSKAPTATKADVAGVALHHPCLITVMSLIAFLW